MSRETISFSPVSKKKKKDADVVDIKWHNSFPLASITKHKLA